ncbi:putative ribonuclease H-like domain-containing protein [Tanacetum coccineum]
MLAKQNNPISKEKKINTTPINYVELNRFSEDFGKRFVSQQELSAEQAFWLKTSHPNTDQFATSPIKIEAPGELPKVSLVNTSLKKLKYHLGKFDTVVKKRITPDAITEGEWGESDKKDRVKQDMDEIEIINIELDHSVAKLLSENELLHKEIEHLKKIYKDQFDSIKKTRVIFKEQCDSLIAQLNSKSMENADLKGQIHEKVLVTTALQNELMRLKGKNVFDNATTLTNATTIALEMFKLDLDPLTLRIQVLLIYVRDTCPAANKPSEKLIVVTPLNKNKKVRFSKPLTSSSNIHKQVESSKTPDSITLVLPSTGLKSSTSASRSQLTCNKKNDRISQTPSSNMKNKVEVQLRRANLSSNIKNRVKDSICDANVKHTMLNANSKLICVKCKQCIFDANHDVCFLDFGNDVNVRSKSKSSKITSTKVVPIKENTSHSVETLKPEIKVYSRRPKQIKLVGCPDCSLVFGLRMFKIYDREPLSAHELRNVIFSREYYVEGLGQNLFSVGQFCDADLEVAFWINTCYIQNLEGVDLVLGSRDTNFYTISLNDMLKTSPICLLSKESKTKSWLWHRRLSHLNFGTLNKLAKDGLARGIPKLKFQKDHLCSACALGKSKKSSHQPKAEDTNQEKLYLLHMDFCGPMQVESLNGKNTAGTKVNAAGLQLFGINKWYQSIALRNFDLEDMEFESTNSGTTAKLPILKLENGDSWVLVPQTTQENGTSVTKMSIPVTAEEKTNKRNDVKARGLLLMALPNEHQLTFSQYLDAKSMFAAIETRFGGNAATKKTQKTLLKQLYENFSASSAESLDSIFNRLQKIVSRLAILGVIIAQEDLNLKFLRSLPPEWNTHVVVWMNKPKVETMSIDDLYKNFKIVKQKVKKTVVTSSGAQNLAFMTAPCTSSTNDANTASLQRTGKKIFINANDTAGYDKSKVECYNYHKLGHFAREYRAPRSKEGQFRNQDNTRKQRNNEDTSSKAMLAIDGIIFDWSDMAEEQVQTNMALMAFSNSEVYTDKTCSKTCLKNYETLNKKCDDLIVKLNQTEFTAATYKRGLALDTVEAQLVTYRKNEVLFSEEVDVLKREIEFKQYEINTLKAEFEKHKKEKENIDFKIEKFDKASKDLDQLLESQITDKSKKGFGYSAVPLAHPLIYNKPNKLDLSYSGLDEFKGYGPENSKKESNIVKESDNSKKNSDKSLVEEQVSQVKSSSVEGCGSNTSKSVSEVEPKKVRKNNDAPIIEDWVSDDEEQDESKTKPEKKTVIPTAAKIEKPVKKSVRYAEMYRSQSPRGNQRNWNGQKSNQLGSEFVMYNKACFICGSFNHVQRNCTYHQKKKVVSGNNYNRVDNYYYAKTSHHRTHKNVTPRAVLLRTGLKPLSTAKSIYTAHPKPTVNTVRPRIVNTARSYRTPVNTVRPRVINTARQNRTSVNAARANGFNAGKPQHDDKGFVDSGCSRHMTGNIAYLSDFKQFDGGYVAFGGGAYGGKISGKGTLKTANLDFEDVYFVNELKFNLFSVLQMCDKKNYVLFTDTECLVLSPNFKLPDENQILLKVPRKDNMYSFDMKNIVPKESLTCIVAKATLDESMLWHRILGHINFKNINKLVKDNLVRGLPTKHFENDQTCVACLKGKQHRASCKSKVLNPITKPLFMLHMDLFGPTFVSSLMHKKYCLVVTDDYSRFTWVFFLTTKDET